MGAQPKKQMSKSKQRSRAAHFKTGSGGISNCPQCRSPKEPHRVCSTCGTYRGRQVLKMPQLGGS